MNKNKLIIITVLSFLVMGVQSSLAESNPPPGTHIPDGGSSLALLAFAASGIAILRGIAAKR